MTYFCIQKYTDNRGNAVGYLLKQDNGQNIEVDRPTVIRMLKDRNNTFLNLKLTSDEKVIFSNNEDIPEVKNNNLVSKALINSTILENFDSYKDLIFAAFRRGNGAEVLSELEEQIKVSLCGMSADLIKARHRDSKGISIESVWVKDGKIVGYRIKNNGYNMIPVVQSEYTDIRKDNVRVKQTKKIVLETGKEIDINILDAVKTILWYGLSGKCSNGYLVHKDIPGNKRYSTKEDFILNYYIDTNNVVVKDIGYLGSNKSELLLRSLGMYDEPKNIKGNSLLSIFKRYSR